MKVKVGDYIESGTPITNLQDLSELEIDFSVPDRYFPTLRPGLNIDVLTSAFPDKVFKASLAALDASVDTGTRNLLLRARLENSMGLLPGMFARLIVDLDQPVRVVTVPETAVTYSLHGNTVYVLTQGKGKRQRDHVWCRQATHTTVKSKSLMVFSAANGWSRSVRTNYIGTLA